MKGLSIEERIKALNKKGVTVSLMFHGTDHICAIAHGFGKCDSLDDENGSGLDMKISKVSVDYIIGRFEQWADEQKESPIRGAEIITEDSTTEAEASQGRCTFDE